MAEDEGASKGHTISLRKQLITGSCIVAWFILNMIITNLNKWIFVRYHFKYPGFLTGVHMLTCAALGKIVLTFFKYPGFLT
eukprot:CAMPEP_0183348218 /NCGR_PEP_ID=MMETSP0164_2-20130417/12801_1 /TAXON_ID=221442 /ORGANISM="Coccolithus pelagicus ssp braarudi, Strain PLY182g" /LENGTH=80 /DNA_ID=CAMNT_0025519775 /DNA_START=19 /DNA_END=258 /DNA_ORIENTATION=-